MKSAFRQIVEMSRGNQNSWLIIYVKHRIENIFDDLKLKI